MALIDKTGVLKVGYDLIDNDHDELYEHTEQHFDRENQLMKQFGFPAEKEHQGEHQRVLGEFKQFKTRIDKGMIAFGRSFVRERLPQWFGLHVTTMDSALAAYIKISPQTLLRDANEKS